jgi:hypothetical protein
MKFTKSIIPVVLILVFACFAMNPVFAEISVEIEPKTDVHVGDTVTITVTPSNDDIVDWYPVLIYVPIPDGLGYVSHVVPDKVLQNYDAGTGIWDVNRMRHDERGHLKYLVITTKVLPEAAGKDITATARFQQLNREINGQDITSDQPRARSDTIYTIIPEIPPDPDDEENKTGNPGEGGNTTGNTTGNSIGNGTNNQNALITSLGNTRITDAMKNFTAGQTNDPLLNLRKSGGGGNGKTYEVSKDSSQDQDSLTNYMLAVLLIIALLVAGYFYEIRRNE